MSGVLQEILRQDVAIKQLSKDDIEARQLLAEVLDRRLVRSCGQTCLEIHLDIECADCPENTENKIRKFLRKEDKDE